MDELSRVYLKRKGDLVSVDQGLTISTRSMLMAGLAERYAPVCGPGFTVSTSISRPKSYGRKDTEHAYGYRVTRRTEGAA